MTSVECLPIGRPICKAPNMDTLQAPIRNLRAVVELQLLDIWAMV